ncbi:MAG: cytochrome c [Myxococcota bacterium]|nr:cytochrome c [Myxococcota bacterium]
MKRKLTTIFFVAGIALLAAGAAHADATGKDLFVKTNCNSCHGMEGRGDGPVAAALTPKPRDYVVGDFKFDADKDGTPGSDADLALVIKNGAAAYGGSAMMMGNPTLSDADIDLLVAYIRSLKE